MRANVRCDFANYFADFFARYLANIEQPFDLMITTDTELKRSMISAHPICGLAENCVIELVENRGRDIAPKIGILSRKLGQYDIFLFLHSKKSPHGQSLASWRVYLLEQLLGTKASTSNIIGLFEEFPNLGIVAAKNFEPVWPSIRWGANFEKGKALAALFGVSLQMEDPIDFPSGSMFWARPLALKPLLDLHLRTSDFEPESGQFDGTLAHQIERLFYISCEHSCLTWLTIARPELCTKKAKIVPAVDLEQIASMMNSNLLLSK